MEQKLRDQDDLESMSSSAVEKQLPEQQASIEASHTLTAIPEEEMKDDETPISWREEPKLFLCDDWRMPLEVMRK